MDLKGTFDFDETLSSGIRVSIDFNNYDEDSVAPSFVALSFDQDVFDYLEGVLTENEELQETEEELYDEAVELYNLERDFISYKTPTEGREAAAEYTQALLEEIDEAAS